MPSHMTSTQRWIAARCAARAPRSAARCAPCSGPGRARRAASARTGAARRSRASCCRLFLARTRPRRSGAADRRLRGGRGRGLVLDGVGDPTQQVGVGHRDTQLRGQLGNGQRERARDVRQNLILIGLIGGAGHPSEQCLAWHRASQFGHSLQTRAHRGALVAADTAYKAPWTGLGRPVPAPHPALARPCHPAEPRGCARE